MPHCTYIYEARHKLSTLAVTPIIKHKQRLREVKKKPSTIYHIKNTYNHLSHSTHVEARHQEHEFHQVRKVKCDWIGRKKIHKQRREKLNVD